MTKTEKILAIVLGVLVALFPPTIAVSHYVGYRSGQLEYARNHIRWTIMEGIIVEFHGLDKPQEAKE